MSPESQVTSSTATQTSTERVLTRRQADLLPVYEVVGRWLQREPAFQHEPEHHLEELALMTASAEWLTRWQPISMHRALLAGATPDQVAEAAGTSVRRMYEQWKQWADGQAPLADRGPSRGDPGGVRDHPGTLCGSRRGIARAVAATRPGRPLRFPTHGRELAERDRLLPGVLAMGAFAGRRLSHALLAYQRGRRILIEHGSP